MKRPAAAVPEKAEGSLEKHFAAAPAASGHIATLEAAQPKPMKLPLKSTALLCIDFQKDFLAEGGFGHALGNDVVGLSAACLPGAAILLAAARAQGLPVVHTREAHRSDLSDCPDSKRTGPRAPPEGRRVGEVMVEGMGRLLVDGSPGNDFVEPARPVEGEKVVCKPGKGAFFLTDLNEHFRGLGVSHLIVCGVTTEVCVQTTMREANDRGYECVLVEDATASYLPKLREAAIEMIRSQGGIVGFTVATSQEVADAIKAAE